MYISKVRRIRKLLPRVLHSEEKNNFNQQSTSCTILFIWILEKAKEKKTAVAGEWATKGLSADGNVLCLHYGGSYMTVYIKIKTKGTVPLKITFYCI